MPKNIMFWPRIFMCGMKESFTGIGFLYVSINISGDIPIFLEHFSNIPYTTWLAVVLSYALIF